MAEEEGDEKHGPEVDEKDKPRRERRSSLSAKRALAKEVLPKRNGMRGLFSKKDSKSSEAPPARTRRSSTRSSRREMSPAPSAATSSEKLPRERRSFSSQGTQEFTPTSSARSESPVAPEWEASMEMKTEGQRRFISSKMNRMIGRDKRTEDGPRGDELREDRDKFDEDHPPPSRQASNKSSPTRSRSPGKSPLRRSKKGTESGSVSFSRKGPTSRGFIARALNRGGKKDVAERSTTDGGVDVEAAASKEATRLAGAH